MRSMLDPATTIPSLVMRILQAGSDTWTIKDFHLAVLSHLLRSIHVQLGSLATQEAQKDFLQSKDTVSSYRHVNGTRNENASRTKSKSSLKERSRKHKKGKKRTSWRVDAKTENRMKRDH